MTTLCLWKCLEVYIVVLDIPTFWNFDWGWGAIYFKQSCTILYISILSNHTQSLAFWLCCKYFNQKQTAFCFCFSSRYTHFVFLLLSGIAHAFQISLVLFSVHFCGNPHPKLLVSLSNVCIELVFEQYPSKGNNMAQINTRHFQSWICKIWKSIKLLYKT